MTASILLTRLGLATLVLTLLAGLLMLARRPLRRWLGAEAVYALWLLVPLGAALCCWPAHREPVPMTAPFAPAAAAPWPALPPTPAALPHAADILLCAWLLGAACGVALLCRRQRAFTRSLGHLVRRGDDTWMSARTDVGPLLVGLPRPRIVLPADADTRYSPQEQAAVLAHERLHRERGDLWWNALCAALRCVFWFHPLGALAQRCFLADQELACDSAVLRGRLHAPRTCADALLKTQAGAALPLGCAMQAGSLLHERIRNLGRRGSPRHVRRVVALLLATVSIAGACLARAASTEQVPADAAAPASGATYRLALDWSVDAGVPHHLDSVVRGAQHLTGLRDEEGRDCEADLVPAGLPKDMVDIRILFTCGGQAVASPRLVARLGTPATVAIGRTERQPDGSFVTTRGVRLTMRFDQP